MALLDVFYVAYEADTSKLEAQVDKMGKKNKKTADELRHEIEDAINKLNEMANKGGGSLEESAKKAGKLSDALKQVGSQASAAGKGLGSAFGTIASSAGGGFGGLGGLGQGLSMLRGGPAALGVAAAATAAAAAAYGVAAAQKAADRYQTIKRDAWSMGMNEKQMLMQQIAGERLGIKREQTLQGISGLFEKLKEVAVYRASPAAQGMQGDTNPLSRLLRQRGIEITAGGHFKDMDKLWDAIVQDLRNVAERKGTNYALARATQQYGLEFNQADRIINASTESIKKMTEGLELAALKELELAAKTKKLTDEKNKLNQEYTKMENAVAQKTVPALTRLIQEFTNGAQKGQSFADTIGDITSKMIDGITKLIQKGKQLVNDVQQSFQESDKDKAQRHEWVMKRREELMKAGVGGEQAYAQAVDEYNKKVQSGEIQTDVSKNRKADEAVDNAKRLQDLYSVRNQFERELGKKEVEKGFQKAAAGGWDTATLETYFKDIIENQKRGLKAGDAQYQAAKELNQMMAQFTSVGLEQAIAMWAGGVGRAGGLGIAGHQTQDLGQSRADFEARSRAIRYTPDRAMLGIGSKIVKEAEKNAGTAKQFYEDSNKTKQVEKNAETVQQNTATTAQQFYEDNNKMKQAEITSAKAEKLSSGGTAGSGETNVNVTLEQVIIQAQTDDAKGMAQQFSEHLQANLSDIYKKVANTRDSVFKR